MPGIVRTRRPLEAGKSARARARARARATGSPSDPRKTSIIMMAVSLSDFIAAGAVGALQHRPRYSAGQASRKSKMRGSDTLRGIPAPNLSRKASLQAASSPHPPAGAAGALEKDGIE